MGCAALWHGGRRGGVETHAVLREPGADRVGYFDRTHRPGLVARHARGCHRTRGHDLRPTPEGAAITNGPASDRLHRNLHLELVLEFQRRLEIAGGVDARKPELPFRRRGAQAPMPPPGRVGLLPVAERWRASRASGPALPQSGHGDRFLHANTFTILSESSVRLVSGSRSPGARGAGVLGSSRRASLQRRQLSGSLK